MAEELSSEQVAVALREAAWMDGLDLFLAWSSQRPPPAPGGGEELRRLRSRDQHLAEQLRVQLKLTAAVLEPPEALPFEKLHLRSVLDEVLRGRAVRNEVPEGLWVHLGRTEGGERAAEDGKRGGGEGHGHPAGELPTGPGASEHLSICSCAEAAIVTESLHKGPHGL